MYASNFIFNGRSLSDFGYIMCEFDGETTTVTPASITFTTAKPPGSKKRYFLSSSIDNVIMFEFSIVKYSCGRTIEDISQYEHSMLERWLCRTDGYKELVIEQKNFDHVCFFANINITPHIVYGRIRGYRLTVETNSHCAYSEPLETEFRLSPSAPYHFYATSDDAGYFYPVWEITPEQNGNLSIKIKEDTGQTDTVLHSVNSGQIIEINSENGIIVGTSPDNFNWVFPRIMQDYEYNFNTITATLPCHIKMKYRLARKAVF